MGIGWRAGVRGVPTGPAARRAVRLAGVVLTLATTGTLLVHVPGYPPARIREIPGQMWLASSAVGQVALVDGSTGEVSARVALRAGERRAGHGDLVVAQSGGDALVADRASGTLTRIHGATHREVGDPVRPLPDAGPGLVVVAGAGAAFAVDAERGAAVALDPITLSSLGPVQSAALTPDPAGGTAGGAAVDHSGRLWVVDAGNGDLVRVDGAGRRTWSRDGARDGAPGDAGTILLTLVDDRPVLVDLRRRTVVVRDPETGDVRDRSCLGTRGDERSVALAGATTGGTVLAASGARGALLVSDVRSGGCTLMIPLTRPGSSLGNPVQIGGTAFVPDYGAGRVHVVDLTRGRVIAAPTVLPPGLPSFELLACNGVAVYNDPRSQRAGVVRLDGTRRPIRKYDPADPESGLPRTRVAPVVAHGADPADGAGGTPGARPTTSAPRPQDPAHRRAEQDRSAEEPSLRVTVSEVPARAGIPLGLRVDSRDGAVLAGATWTFGDASGPEEGLTTTHTWLAPGRYRVSVTARTVGGRDAVTTVTVTVEPRAAHRPPGDESGDPAPTGSPAPTPTTSPTAPPPTSTSFTSTAPTTTTTVQTTPTITTPPTGDVALSLLVAGQGTVSVDPASPLGGTCGPEATCVWPFPRGRRVTLRAPDQSAQGSAHFAGWDGCPEQGQGGEQHWCAVTLTGATSITARFVPDPATATVRVRAGEGGGVTGTDGSSSRSCAPECTFVVPVGTTVRLSASPAEGYAFDGWTGASCPPGALGCELIPAQPGVIEVVAAFRPLPPVTLTVDLSGGDGSGRVHDDLGVLSCSGSSCSGSYPQGTRVTLGRDATAGARWVGWSGCASAEGESCVVDLGSGGARVTATFRDPIHTLTLRTLSCSRTEDWTGADEAYLTVDGRRVWGPVAINDGQSRYVGYSMTLTGSATVVLWDDDSPDGDDNLGGVTVTPGMSSPLTFTGDDARYTLGFDIESW